jgi:hypothetical protein
MMAYEDFEIIFFGCSDSEWVVLYWVFIAGENCLIG